MKRIWLQNESDKLFADRQWCEDKVWDDEDCTAYIPEDKAQAIIDEAVGLFTGLTDGIDCEAVDMGSCDVDFPEGPAPWHEAWLHQVHDFIDKHSRSKDDG